MSGTEYENSDFNSLLNTLNGSERYGSQPLYVRSQISHTTPWTQDSSDTFGTVMFWPTEARSFGDDSSRILKGVTEGFS